MTRPKQFHPSQVAMMFREFGIDLAARIGHIQEPQRMVQVFGELKAEAKVEFKRLALKFHPDRNGGDDTEFKRLNSIWQILEELNPIFQPRPRPVVMQPGIRIVVTHWPSSSTTTTTTSSVTGGGYW